MELFGAPFFLDLVSAFVPKPNAQLSRVFAVVEHVYRANNSVTLDSVLVSAISEAGVDTSTVHLTSCPTRCGCVELWSSDLPVRLGLRTHQLSFEQAKFVVYHEVCHLKQHFEGRLVLRGRPGELYFEGRHYQLLPVWDPEGANRQPWEVEANRYAVERVDDASFVTELPDGTLLPCF